MESQQCDHEHAEHYYRHHDDNEDYYQEYRIRDHWLAEVTIVVGEIGFSAKNGQEVDEETYGLGDAEQH